MSKTIRLHPKHIDAHSSYADIMAAAIEKEADGDIVAAVALYQKCIALKPKSERAYTRLMIMYRKQKEYKKEIALIKSGIKVFESIYKSKKPVTTIISRLSKNILKSTGLVDTNGCSNFKHQPVDKWTKRLHALTKRLKR